MLLHCLRGPGEHTLALYRIELQPGIDAGEHCIETVVRPEAIGTREAEPAVTDAVRADDESAQSHALQCREVEAFLQARQEKRDTRAADRGMELVARDACSQELHP